MPAPPKPTQRRRPIAITTPLGQDALLLNRFTLRERLSNVFEIEAELSSVDANIDYRSVVGHPAGIRLHMGSHGTRYFHGYVSRFMQVADQGHFARYRATIVPWIWFLTRTSDCRVFQRESVPEIAEDIFNAHRFGSEFYELRLKGRYPKRRYCVQYNETDFNFISRLLEGEGIYYWFDHTQTRHRLVLADGLGASKSAKGFEKLNFNASQARADEGRTEIGEWTVQQEVQSVGYLLKDFDFKKPSHPLTARHEIPRGHGNARFAIYDYPGEYFEPDQAERYARLRLEELQARHEIVQGVTVARGLAAGAVFEMRAHPRDDQNRKYLITSVNLTADAGEFASRGSGQEFFSCHFTAIPAGIQYRPPRLTPKPVIQGIQTATVVGQKGKEVDPDDFGRVKVQFHWDRYGKMDEQSSCWVRVSQPWAGKGFGCMNIPRIGQEVVVEFIEGDPDRPLINGRLYNAENMPHASNSGRDGKPGNAKPSGIEQAAMMTSFKTNSLGGGGGHNEITMNDAAGKEGLFIKAQKDEIHKVGNDREREVGHDETIQIKHDRTTTVDNDQKETIKGNKTIDVTKSHSESIGKNMDLSVKMMKNESVGLASTENVGGAKALSVGAAYAVTVGGAMNTAVGLASFEEVGLTKQVVVGKTLRIQAGESIELVVGNSVFILKKDGTINLSGKDIDLTGEKHIQLGAERIDIN